MFRGYMIIASTGTDFSTDWFQKHNKALIKLSTGRIEIKVFIIQKSKDEEL